MKESRRDDFSTAAKHTGSGEKPRKRLAAVQNRGAAEKQTDDARCRASGEDGTGEQETRQLGCGTETRPAQLKRKVNHRTAAARRREPATRQNRNRVDGGANPSARQENRENKNTDGGAELQPE
jgi:hypothetical protein